MDRLRNTVAGGAAALAGLMFIPGSPPIIGAFLALVSGGLYWVTAAVAMVSRRDGKRLGAGGRDQAIVA